MDIFKYKERVDEFLYSYFTDITKGKEGIELELLNNLRDFTMRGGKRLRPLFMILGYWLNSDEINNEVIKASSSLELIQSYLLIHDDIMDESNLRRGGPTYHKMFNYTPKISHDLAIVAGDVANSLAYELLLSSKFPEKNLNKSAYYLTEILKFTGIGQAIDVTLTLKKDKSASDVDLVHEYKTAHYTINGPLKMGAALSEFPDVDRIDEYGIPLGKAFQIQDDILGLFGDEKVLGKPVTSDLEEGKITHLIVFALEMANEDERKELMKIHGKKGIAQEELNLVREIVRKSGAYDRTVRLMNSYLDKSLEVIPKIAKDQERAKTLEDIAHYMVKRNF